MNLDHFRDKSILILGLGREGFDSLNFFLDRSCGHRIGVADKQPYAALGSKIKQILQKNPQVKRHFGAGYLKEIANYDVIVKSPGIPIHLPEIEDAHKMGKITSQIEIFFKNCPGTIIGITGTKGKSTTSAIIYEILKQAGKKAHLVGNIGTPVLSYLKNSSKEDFFVCELSAHQLYGLSKSPHISVLLNIYSEHLDYYTDINEYIRAKANIALYQKKSDYLIYNSSNRTVAKIAARGSAKKIAFNEYDWQFSGKTKLIGNFNLENAKAGVIIGRILGVPDSIINLAISNFTPLQHRLEYVGSYNGIDCYNDSLSTIQESAIAAIASLGDRIQTLVAGGFDRAQPFDGLAKSILGSQIENLILFPTTGARIWDQIVKLAKKPEYSQRFLQLKPFFVDSMPKAAEIIMARTDHKRICLLSAASASFSGFKDYAERGIAFKKSLASAMKKPIKHSNSNER